MGATRPWQARHPVIPPTHRAALREVVDTLRPVALLQLATQHLKRDRTRRAKFQNLESRSSEPYSLAPRQGPVPATPPHLGLGDLHIPLRADRFPLPEVGHGVLVLGGRVVVRLDAGGFTPVHGMATPRGAAGNSDWVEDWP